MSDLANCKLGRGQPGAEPHTPLGMHSRPGHRVPFFPLWAPQVPRTSSPPTGSKPATRRHHLPASLHWRLVIGGVATAQRTNTQSVRVESILQFVIGPEKRINQGREHRCPWGFVAVQVLETCMSVLLAHMVWQANLQ